jgi:hypothetical protein
LEFMITDSHPNMLEYVDHLQRLNVDSLSFYPKACFEREIPKKRILMALLNGEPCGYLYFGALKGIVKIHQVCIEYDLRRRLYGAWLIGDFEKKALQAQVQAINLRCGFDLEANKFWQELGYYCIGIVDGGIRRMRKINIWEKTLQPMMELPKLEPAVGEQDASYWRKNKRVGIINQFNRGGALRDYKRLILPPTE